MVSSIKERRQYDKACVLDKGDHEFITHPSYIVYRIAETVQAAHITNMVEKKYYREKGTISEKIYDKIADGLSASDETRPRILKYAIANGVCDN